MNRLKALDALRGLIMIIMLLDHTRHLFGPLTDPTDLSLTTPKLFFTRWITHFCAPVFAILAGVSVFLIQQKKGISLARSYVVQRALVLLALDFTLVRFAFMGNWNYGFIPIGVLSVLGIGMLMTAALLEVNAFALGSLVILIICLHNALDTTDLPIWLKENPFWMLFHQMQAYDLSPLHKIFFLYNILPWSFLVVLGYLVGPLMTKGIKVRIKYALVSGTIFILIFCVLRFFNLYGDPKNWVPQANFIWNTIAILNCNKYPASLLYLLMTLGPALLVYSLFEFLQKNRAITFLQIYGQVPLFFYLSHLLVLRALTLFLAENSLSLNGTYTLYAALALSFYPICYYYGQIKAKRRYRLLEYL